MPPGGWPTSSRDRSPGHGPRAAGARIVATLDGHLGQADDRDGIERIGVGGLPVEALGLVDEPHRQRPVGLEQELDHRRPGWLRTPAGVVDPCGKLRLEGRLVAEPAADIGQQRLSGVALGVGDDGLQQSVEQAAEQRSGRHAALVADVVAIDGQVAERQRHPALELGRDPLAQLVDAARVGGFAAAEVVGLAQPQQPWQRLAPDLRRKRRTAPSLQRDS